MMAIPPNKPRPNNLRFDRQFLVLERQFPALSGPLRAMRTGRGRLIRIPVAIFLILGGFLAILPVFNLWMLPIGLLLLAVDIRALQGPVSALIVRGRRRITGLIRRYRR